jgi:hypothetical protein
MLFAERSEDRRFSEDARLYIASKTLKMLDWIATITEAEEDITSDDTEPPK